MKNPKFELFRGKDRKFYFHLRARNGEILLNSQGYTSKDKCLNGIFAIKDIAKDAPVQEIKEMEATS